MLPPISLLHDKKKLLRERMRAERRAAAKARPDAAVHAARHFMDAIKTGPETCIALYDPIDSELHVQPLYDALIERGAPLCLPIVIKKKAPLVFRNFEDGAPLIDGAYGARVPDENAKIVRPNVVVVPLLAYDRRGGRLGYGGGFYDRTLVQLRENGTVTAVGYAFGAQHVDDLPLTAQDQPLDWVVTERGAMKFNSGAAR